MKLLLENNIFRHLLTNRLDILNVRTSQSAALSHFLIEFLAKLSRLVGINSLEDNMTNLIKLRNNHSGNADSGGGGGCKPELFPNHS